MRFSNSVIQAVEQIPDSAKTAIVLPAPVFTLMGVPVEQWVFVLSGIFTILLIIEKIPKAYAVVKTAYRKLFKRKNRDGREDQ